MTVSIQLLEDPRHRLFKEEVLSVSVSNAVLRVAGRDTEWAWPWDAVLHVEVFGYAEPIGKDSEQAPAEP